MVRVGIAGIGFMGWIHWLAYQSRDDVEVVAICTPEPERRAGDWSAIQGNFGPPGEQVDLSSIATYAELDEFLQDPQIDLVDLCLPPALHVSAVRAAAEAGKHVFCEKPLALTPDDCDAAVTACQTHQRMLMVGQVLPFFPEFRFARELIDSGVHGRLLGGAFKRVISDPQWLKGFYDPARIGGPLLDLHVHDAHFIRLIFGMPREVCSVGRMRNGVVDYCNSIFRYESGGPTVSSTMGVINQQGRPFTHGFEIHLERATLQFEFAGLASGAELMPLKVLPEDGTVEYPVLGEGDPLQAFRAEIGEVVASLESGQPSPILSGELAKDAIRICAAQAEAVTSGKCVVIP